MRLKPKKCCLTCRQDLDIKKFGINRAKSDGRQSHCKKCWNKKAIEIRSVRPRYTTADGPITPGPRIHHTCEVCEQDYLPMRYTQRCCVRCSPLLRTIWSHLTSGRPGQNRATVNRQTVLTATRKWHRSTSCIYCHRPYTKTNYKSIDHQMPVCRGGKRNDPENLVICCIECNRSKARMTVDEWINHCCLVAQINRPSHVN